MSKAITRIARWFQSSSARRSTSLARLSALQRAAMEGLERRQLLSIATISNGTGDGSVQITVDAYGAYGSGTSAGDAIYDPFGSQGPGGTTKISGIYFGPAASILTESAFGAQLPSVTFSSVTPNAAISNFSVAGFDVLLTQFLDPITAEGSRFTQVYEFTNNSGHDLSFLVARFADGQLAFDGTATDYSSVSGDGRHLYTFDNAADPTASTVYFGVTANDPLPPPNLTDGTSITPEAWTIQPAPQAGTIINTFGIPLSDYNQIFGDANGDRMTDTGYDTTLALEDRLVIPNGKTLSYVTRTNFGQMAPQLRTSTGEFRFSQPQYSLYENGGTATIVVQRINGTAGEASVGFGTSDGTAFSGMDYTGVNGTLTFLDGVTELPFVVPILDDSFVEPDEFFDLSLAGPTNGATLGNPSGATFTILDDDLPGQLQFSNSSYQVLENAGFAAILVSRINGASGAASVDFATTDGTAVAGRDYSAVSGTLNFAQGEIAQVIIIPIIDDGQGGVDKTFSLTLSNPVGATLGDTSAPSVSVPVTVVETTPTYRFTQTNYAVHENAGIAAIEVERTGGNQIASSVSYLTTDGTALSGTDYTAVAGTLDFAAGQNKLAITIPILLDQEAEPTETVNIQLSTGETALLDILDSDAQAPTVSDVRFIAGRKGLNGVVVQFSEAMAGLDLKENMAHYSIFSMSKRGDLLSVPMDRIGYDASANTMTLLPRKPLKLNQLYELNVISAGLTDLAGNALDGNGDGIGGDNYRTSFGRGTRFNYTDGNGDLVKLQMARGSMDLFRAPDGEATTLRLVDTVAGRSRLSGSVRKVLGAGDGVTTIQQLLNTGGVDVLLPDTMFIINRRA